VFEFYVPNASISFSTQFSICFVVVLLVVAAAQQQNLMFRPNRNEKKTKEKLFLFAF